MSVLSFRGFGRMTRYEVERLRYLCTIVLEVIMFLSDLQYIASKE